MRHSAVLGSLLVFLAGCAVVAPMSASARAQETATELNTNSRFGRMELATEHVDPAQREAFLGRHKTWGNAIRVADYEMAGFKMKGDNDAETLVRVSWYRVENGDLKNTLIKQSWKQVKGDWRLVEEVRADGDAGLIGDPAPPAPADAAPAAPAKKHFPTIRLGSTENAPPANAESGE
jgi:hypothetical protein